MVGDTCCSRSCRGGPGQDAGQSERSIIHLISVVEVVPQKLIVNFGDAIEILWCHGGNVRGVFGSFRPESANRGGAKETETVLIGELEHQLLTVHINAKCLTTQRNAFLCSS